MCYQTIKDIVLCVRWLKDRKIKQKKKILKERLLRYFENGQRNVHGSFSQTKSNLLVSNLLKSDGFDIVSEALTELVNEGCLEYEGGSYYLKGQAPKF